ncbi:PhzF family phenazine biosynthesis protein [Parasphingorhabdus sp. DH2-15]|uniref:PhzF family phenazine biosynthesis protein n=1 Tax=Parasphingorhabdus sp. DH2-15 TaxID=3444112 RepID=UPI003F682B39
MTDSMNLPNSLSYCHIDAFASRPFTGNQAAVMPLQSWPDDAVLQAIGEENNFAETAFILPDASGESDYELRWFTPEVEIALCGHATLASGHYILKDRPDLDHVTFRTRKAGILEVHRDTSLGEHAYRLALPSYAPAPAERASWTDLLGAEPIAREYHPGRYNILRFATAADVLALSPDLKALKAVGDDQFICTAPGDGHSSGADVISRVFVPGGGVDEDSVTGSAHAVLTPYWAKQLGRDSFTAYQASQRGGLVGCRLDGERAWLSGQCCTIVEGTFYLG